MVVPHRHYIMVTNCLTFIADISVCVNMFYSYLRFVCVCLCTCYMVSTKMLILRAMQGHFWDVWTFLLLLTSSNSYESPPKLEAEGCVCVCVSCDSPAPACFLMALNSLSPALKIILRVYNLLTHVRFFKWREDERNVRTLEDLSECVTEYNSSGSVSTCWAEFFQGRKLSQRSTLEWLKWEFSKCWWGQMSRISQR